MKDSKIRHRTATSVVLDILTEADDFLTTQVVCAKMYGARGAYNARATVNAHLVRATLDYLRKRKAADCMEVAGLLWWFATPTEDNRSRKFTFRVEETNGRRRKPRKQGESPDA